MSTQLLWGDPAVTGDTELTIGIPSYRRTRTLREAIDSVLALPRDKVKFQLIISEDESDRHEEIRQIVESYGDPRIVYYYNTPALGMNENWTQCARLAKTKYIALLHDDDYLKPNYLDVVDNLLHRSPVHFDVVSFNHDILQDADGIIRPRPDDKGLYGKLQKNRFRRHTPGDFYFGALQCLLMPSCGILFDRESLLGGVGGGGGYKKEYGYLSDLIFFEIFCHDHDAYYLQKNVAVARAGEDNISRARTTKIAFTTEGVAHRLKMGGVYRFWNRVFGEAGLKWALSYPWHDALFPGEKISAPSRARGQLYRLVREIYLAARGIRVGLFSPRYKDNA